MTQRQADVSTCCIILPGITAQEQGPAKDGRPSDPLLMATHRSGNMQWHHCPHSKDCGRLDRAESVRMHASVCRLQLKEPVLGVSAADSHLCA